jgi:hypothetical protein
MILVRVLFPAPSASFLVLPSPLNIIVIATAVILSDRVVLSPVIPDIVLGAFLALSQVAIAHHLVAVELIQRLLYLALEANLASHGVSPLEWSIAPLPLDAQG